MARRGGSSGVEDAVRADWRHRFAELLVSNPGARQDLELALRQLSALASQQSNRTVTMQADARDQGRNYQSAGDMVINE